MRYHRFHFPDLPPEEREFELGDQKLIHQWRNVFRLRSGDRIILFSGDGHERACTITEIAPGAARVRPDEVLPSISPGSRITLYPSLIKKDKLEWVLEKGTEIGVSAFAPVIAERSEKKGWNRERMERILIEATEQSGWGRVPTLSDPEPLSKILGNLTHPIALDGRGDPLSRTEIPGTGEISILVGPEGGFSPEEIDVFRSKDIPLRALGASTLRAETASIVAAALFLLG